MAEDATITDSACWARALYNYEVAKAAFDAVDDCEPCPALADITRTCQDAQNTVYATPAPNFAAVIQKLELRWSFENLIADVSPFRRLIIGDLRRIEGLALGLDEAEDFGRSPQEVKEAAAKWCAALAEYEDLERLLAEGPSDRWGDRTSGDIIDELFAAADTLLSLPGPTIHAVIKKLEVFWEDDRLDPLDGPAYVHIVGNLNWLARKISGRAY